MQEAFDLKEQEVISLVGGGGKTSLMFALARELVTAGHRVLTTTTTKILEAEPSLHGFPFLVVEEDEERLIEQVLHKLGERGQVTAARARLPAQGKLQGLTSEMVDKLACSSQTAYIIVEADGAAHRPLKAPNSSEPVIPPSTTLVVPVVGLEALGLPLTEENVFRSHLASELTGVPLGGTVTMQAIATLVVHPKGMAKGTPASARLIPFINKLDRGEPSAARELAATILQRGHPLISRVVLGQVKKDKPALEVILSKGSLPVRRTP